MTGATIRDAEFGIFGLLGRNTKIYRNGYLVSTERIDINGICRTYHAVS